MGVFSFRHGVGKSTVAMIAAGLASAAGLRVGLVDANVQSPGLHLHFGLGGQEEIVGLDELLRGSKSIEACVYEITDRLGDGVGGKLFLVPASATPIHLSIVLRELFDVETVSGVLQAFSEYENLDLLIVDSPAGLTEPTMTIMALSDLAAILMQTDEREYQGTSVLAGVARKLSIQRMGIIVNNVPAEYDPSEVGAKVEETFDCPVLAVLPHSPNLEQKAGAPLSVFSAANEPLSKALRGLVNTLIE